MTEKYNLNVDFAKSATREIRRYMRNQPENCVFRIIFTKSFFDIIHNYKL